MSFPNAGGPAQSSGLPYAGAAAHPPAQLARRLVERVARLNPDAGEIGAGMLVSLVSEARRIVAMLEAAAPAGDAIDGQLRELRTMIDRRTTRAVASVDLQCLGRSHEGDLTRVWVHTTEGVPFDLRGFAWNFSASAVPLYTGPRDFVTVVGDAEHTKRFLGTIPTRVVGVAPVVGGVR